MLRRIAASVAVVTTAAGLMAFAHYGSFDNGRDPFPYSIVTPG